ncbi:DUF4238 domain-containing protein [Thalassobellus suaedae]|uniref:DUF4238 domain-containing protein n=1 Tax=Thalassobellus suaedae TaxID=3074124 RepID=A0ABY9Y6Z1_9FLAO|nr:DUF4238 domain-containing protein [Flavobacteriaceae bacterium HL-DH10]
MNYNLFQRKETEISQKELDWIDENLDEISKKENVLFIFQAEHEALVITNKSIYFPNRKSLLKVQYSQINKIKIRGDFHIEFTHLDLKKYTIVFVSPIDKVKMILALNLLKKNEANKVETTFEDIENLFNDFTVIKFPPNQDQHKLPQVYLKEFGYLNKEQWMVSIIKKGEKFTRQKSIGSFTAETNVFDIESEDDRFPRMFESLNCDLENLYHEMLKDLDDNDEIPDKCWEIIVQFTPNMMIRSDFWRSFIKGILESEHKNTFLEITISVLSKSYEDLQSLKEKDFYKLISEGELTNSKLNRVLILFLNYIFHHLKPLKLIVLEAPDGNEFYTSDCPVNFIPNQIEGKLGLFSINTEVYFPLSPKYLAYFHFEGSENSNPIFKELKNRGIYKVIDIMSEEEYYNLIQNLIIKASDELIIIPKELKLKG